MKAEMIRHLCALTLLAVLWAPGVHAACTESPAGQQNCTKFVSSDQNPTGKNVASVLENKASGENTPTVPIGTPTPGTLEILDDRAGAVAAMENWVIRWLSSDGARGVVLPLRKLFVLVSGVYPVQWYGAACNGTTNDTTAVQAAYDALPATYGGTIRLCAPMKFGEDAGGNRLVFTKPTTLRFAETYQDVTLNGPIIWSSVSGGGVEGINKSKSRFVWAGNNDPTDMFAVLQGWSCQHLQFRHFAIVAPLNVPYQTGLAFASTYGGSNVSVEQTVDDVYLVANRSEVWHGVRLLGGVCMGGTNANQRCTNDAAGQAFCNVGTHPGVCTYDANNSENVFRDLECANNSGPCLSVEHAQSFGNVAYNLTGGAANTTLAGPSLLCPVNIGWGGACITGDSARRGAFCLDADDCLTANTGAVCTGATPPPAGNQCNTDTLVSTCYTNGGTCSVPGVCDGGADAGNTCASTNPPCAAPGVCRQGCAVSATNGGSLSIWGGLLSSAQRAAICAGPIGESSVFQNIDSESSQAALYVTGPAGRGANVTLDHWRYALNRSSAARRCHMGSNDPATCTKDADCTGSGYCGGCTALRTGVVRSARCEGGTEPGTVECRNGQSDCDSRGLGGTCTLQTRTRPCCTGDGAGVDCDRPVVFKTGNSITISNSNFSEGTDSGQTPVAYTFHIDTGTGNVATGHVENVSFQTTATVPFTRQDVAQSWTSRSVKIPVIPFTGPWTTLRDVVPAPRMFPMADDRLQAEWDLSALPTPAGAIPTPVILSPFRRACTTVANVTSTTDNYAFFIAPSAIQVTGVACSCVGTCSPTLATFTLENRAGTGMTITGTNPTCAISTGNATFAAVTANNVLSSGDRVAFDVSNTPDPATDTYQLCINYLELP